MGIHPHTFTVQDVLRQHPCINDLVIPVIQAINLCQEVGEGERRWWGNRWVQQSFAPDYRSQGTSEAIWRGRGGFLGEGDITRSDIRFYHL